MDEEDAGNGIGIDEPMLSGSMPERENREVVIDKNDPEIEILQGSATNNQKSPSVSTRFADLKNENCQLRSVLRSRYEVALFLPCKGSKTGSCEFGKRRF